MQQVIVRLFRSVPIDWKKRGGLGDKKNNPMPGKMIQTRQRLPMFEFARFRKYILTPIHLANLRLSIFQWTKTRLCI